MALLGGAGEPQSLNELARAAGMDKSQMSRVVSGLTQRRIVLRETDANDARGIRLSLTAIGKKPVPEADPRRRRTQRARSSAA